MLSRDYAKNCNMKILDVLYSMPRFKHCLTKFDDYPNKFMLGKNLSQIDNDYNDDLRIVEVNYYKLVKYIVSQVLLYNIPDVSIIFDNMFYNALKTLSFKMDTKFRSYIWGIFEYISYSNASDVLYYICGYACKSADDIVAVRGLSFIKGFYIFSDGFIELVDTGCYDRQRL